MKRQNTSIPSEYRLLLGLVSVIVVSYVVTQWLLSVAVPNASKATTDVTEVVIITGFTTAGLWFTVVRYLQARHHSQAFDQQLQTALQMAPNEAAGYEVLDRALTAAKLVGHAQLKLADSSEAHLKVAVDHKDGPSVQTCDVVGPFDCPAIRRAQTSRFASDRALDACPWLIQAAAQQPDGGDVGAVCVPLNVVGRAIGVLHLAAPSDQLPKPATVVDMESIAERAGARIGMLRVLEQTHLQAATDPLTGLLNRRSLENQLHDLIRSNRGFSLVMGDLDHFKMLNDTHGHEAGDRALRVFATTVRSVLRAEDIISRYGGEEFVFVLPDRSSAEAVGAFERVREALALAVNAGNIAPFTSSFGVAHSSSASNIEDLIRLADNALFRAKRAGRNRVVVDGDPALEGAASGVAEASTARAPEPQDPIPTLHDGGFTTATKG